MNKVIHTLNLDKNLHALALAWTQSQNIFENAVESAREDFPEADDCPVEIRASLTAMGVLQESLQAQFWGAVNEILPDKYADNKQQCNPAKGLVRVLSEKVPNEPDECECDDDETASLDEIMSQAGVQNQDEWGRA